MTKPRDSEWADFFNGHAPEYEKNCFTGNNAYSLCRRPIDLDEIEIMVAGVKPAERRAE